MHLKEIKPSNESEANQNDYIMYVYIASLIFALSINKYANALQLPQSCIEQSM